MFFLEVFEAFLGVVDGGVDGCVDDGFFFLVESHGYCKCFFDRIDALWLRLLLLWLLFLLLLEML